MKVELYRGVRRLQDAPTGEAGEYWTDDAAAAQNSGPFLFAAKFSFNDETVVVVEGYDPDEHDPGAGPLDDPAALAAAVATGADAARYDDQDPCQNDHDCWMLLRDTAANVKRFSGECWSCEETAHSVDSDGDPVCEDCC